MSKPKVIVTRRWPAAVEQALEDHFDVELNADDRPLDKAALMDALTRADALFPTVTDRIDAEILSASPLRCRLIGNFGVGFNNIDIQTAKAKGIAVTNTPDVLTHATADLTMALLLAVARRLGEGERHVRAKAWSGWRPTHMMGTQVTGKTLGLIGLGRIGAALAQKASRGFDMQVQAYDPFPPAAGRLTEVGRHSRRQPRKNLRDQRLRLDPLPRHPGKPPFRQCTSAKVDETGRPTSSTPPAATSSTKSPWSPLSRLVRSRVPALTCSSKNRRSRTPS